MIDEKTVAEEQKLSFAEVKQAILEDYKLANISRQASLLGRKEVLTGKAKFGIFGDGKEIAQIAMAKAFRDGDFRSGYYRDQTFMFAIGQLTVKQFFAQLYADTTPGNDPASSGRQMNGHFATRSLDENGDWKNLMEQKNSSADISPTAGQMQRLLGLAYASKIYRHNKDLESIDTSKFSDKGNEVAFGTIGNASTAEGPFWETVNAGGVLQVPMAISIWDDGYGISVPNDYQVTKQDLSEILSGFSYDENKGQGYLLRTARGWDYPALVKMYEDGIDEVREKHIPAIFHIKEMTQPQGHSTSGSHERYKSKERLEWEEQYDCLKKMREWVLEHLPAIMKKAALENDESLSSSDARTQLEEELDNIEKESKAYVRQEQKAALEEATAPIKNMRASIVLMLNEMAAGSENGAALQEVAGNLQRSLDIDHKSNSRAIWDALRITRNEQQISKRQQLVELLKEETAKNAERYNENLYTGTAMQVEEVPATYANDAPQVDGREVLLSYFEQAFKNDPRLIVFGEDVGKIGDVNQGLAGMQEKFGEIRVTDTGIRETTIIGQGIGAAMRGLRPIAEIQYLDYLLYGIQILSDDLSTLLYRTNAGQKAPMIVRTRGHRLEGIWHSGSPMGMILNSLRGMYVCVPRNMTQAAGFYNTLLKSDEPGLIIERLNAYRLKEKLPENLLEYTLPLGIPEIMEEGTDITIVTYGACTDIARDATAKLRETGISAELIDARTLLPFDVNHMIVDSLKKTNRILFLDEDVPGGATAYMMREVLEIQDGYRYLDSRPATLSAKAHRPPYGTDGDYFSKPSAEDIFLAVYNVMHEADPAGFPEFI